MSLSEDCVNALKQYGFVVSQPSPSVEVYRLTSLHNAEVYGIWEPDHDMITLYRHYPKIKQTVRISMDEAIIYSLAA